MKIDTDLRNAIRSAHKAQPDEDWQTQAKAERQAVEALAAKPKYAAAIKAARAKLKKAEKINEEASAIFKTLGISDQLHRIHNDEAFAKAGGRRPLSKDRWNFDEVMASLAKATPKEGAAILAKLGIKWN